MFPAGCRIHFTLISRNGVPVSEDILEARDMQIVDGNVVRILDAIGAQIRTVNFNHVLTIQPLVTVGPGGQNAHN